MGQQKQRNLTLGSGLRPHGAPVPENFRREEDDVATPGEGQVLLRLVICPWTRICVDVWR